MGAPGYKIRVRITDDQVRFSGWTEYFITDGLAFTMDQTVPIGGIAINAGAQYATSTSVALDLSSKSDPGDASSGVADVMVSENSDFSGASWQSHQDSLPFTLSGGDAEKTVYIKYRDNAGNESSLGSDNIILDTLAPAAFNPIAPADNTWQNDATPSLSWDATTDGGSGMSHYELWVDDALDEANATSPQIAGTITEGRYSWYVKAVDNAGNWRLSTGESSIGDPETSPAWNVGHDQTVPGTPLTFTASSSQSKNIDINWDYSNDNGSPMAEYKLERMTWNDHLASEIWDGTTTSYYSYTYTGTNASHTEADAIPDEAITKGIKYAYRISAKDMANGSYGSLSSIISGLTTDNVAPPDAADVTVEPCDGTSYCSTLSTISHKGFENKITWDQSIDTGVGTTHYIIYRSTNDINSSTFNDSAVLQSYVKIGVLPYSALSPRPTWYDNDANNLATSNFYDNDDETPSISDTSGEKTQASDKLNDYTVYYYRVTAVDDNGNEQRIFPEISLDGQSHDILLSYLNGNQGTVAEMTPDVTVPSVPSDLIAAPKGLDGVNNQGDPKQAVEITWTYSSDAKAAERIPTGDGSGVSGYKVFRALGNEGGPTESFFEIDTDTASPYTDTRLEEFQYYYYKVQAVDSVSSTTIIDPLNNNSAQSSQSQVRTASNSVPDPPSSVTVTTLQGDSSTDEDVGHQNTVTFNGSYTKNCSGGIRCLVGYEIYRSATNDADEDTFVANGELIADISITPVLDEKTLVYKYIDNNATNNSTSPTISTCTTNCTDNNNFSTSSATIAKAQTSPLVSATTYYYRIRAKDNTPANPDLGPFESSLNSVAVGTLHSGWDTTADDKAPDPPSQVNVKDIWDDGLNSKRVIINWKRIADPDRNG